LRSLGETLGEMKRLYVRPSFRHQGIGLLLARAVIDAAQDIGYLRLRLDTLPSMTAALALYESLGFRRIRPYGATPSDCALFMELDLLNGLG
jgi:ribosomal protein S18 acetylase RimI-like enzyme